MALSPTGMLPHVLRASGLSQTTLAEVLGTDGSSFRRWLSSVPSFHRDLPDAPARLVWVLYHHTSFVEELATYGSGNTLARLLWISHRHPRALAEMIEHFDAGV